MRVFFIKPCVRHPFPLMLCSRYLLLFFLTRLCSAVSILFLTWSPLLFLYVYNKYIHFIFAEGNVGAATPITKDICEQRTRCFRSKCSNLVFAAVISIWPAFASVFFGIGANNLHTTLSKCCLQVWGQEQYIIRKDTFSPTKASAQDDHCIFKAAIFVKYCTVAPSSGRRS